MASQQRPSRWISGEGSFQNSARASHEQGPLQSSRRASHEQGPFQNCRRASHEQGPSVNSTGASYDVGPFHNSTRGTTSRILRSGKVAQKRSWHTPVVDLSTERSPSKIHVERRANERSGSKCSSEGNSAGNEDMIGMNANDRPSIIRTIGTIIIKEEVDDNNTYESCDISETIVQDASKHARTIQYPQWFHQLIQEVHQDQSNMSQQITTSGNTMHPGAISTVHVMTGKSPDVIYVPTTPTTIYFQPPRGCGNISLNSGTLPRLIAADQGNIMSSGTPRDSITSHTQRNMLSSNRDGNTFSPITSINRPSTLNLANPAVRNTTPVSRSDLTHRQLLQMLKAGKSSAAGDVNLSGVCQTTVANSTRYESRMNTGNTPMFRQETSRSLERRQEATRCDNHLAPLDLSQSKNKKRKLQNSDDEQPLDLSMKRHKSLEDAVNDILSPESSQANSCERTDVFSKPINVLPSKINNQDQPRSVQASISMDVHVSDKQKNDGSISKSKRPATVSTTSTITMPQTQEIAGVHQVLSTLGSDMAKASNTSDCASRLNEVAVQLNQNHAKSATVKDKVNPIKHLATNIKELAQTVKDTRKSLDEISPPMKELITSPVKDLAKYIDDLAPSDSLEKEQMDEEQLDECCVSMEDPTKQTEEENVEIPSTPKNIGQGKTRSNSKRSLEHANTKTKYVNQVENQSKKPADDSCSEPLPHHMNSQVTSTDHDSTLKQSAGKQPTTSPKTRSQGKASTEQVSPIRRSENNVYSPTRVTRSATKQKSRSFSDDLPFDTEQNVDLNQRNLLDPSPEQDCEMTAPLQQSQSFHSRIHSQDKPDKPGACNESEDKEYAIAEDGAANCATSNDVTYISSAKCTTTNTMTRKRGKIKPAQPNKCSELMVKQKEQQNPQGRIILKITRHQAQKQPDVSLPQETIGKYNQDDSNEDKDVDVDGDVVADEEVDVDKDVGADEDDGGENVDVEAHDEQPFLHNSEIEGLETNKPKNNEKDVLADTAKLATESPAKATNDCEAADGKNDIVPHKHMSPKKKRGRQKGQIFVKKSLSKGKTLATKSPVKHPKILVSSLEEDTDDLDTSTRRSTRLRTSNNSGRINSISDIVTATDKDVMCNNVTPGHPNAEPSPAVTKQKRKSNKEQTSSSTESRKPTEDDEESNSAASLRNDVGISTKGVPSKKTGASNKTAIKEVSVEQSSCRQSKGNKHKSKEQSSIHSETETKREKSTEKQERNKKHTVERNTTLSRKSQSADKSDDSVRDTSSKNHKKSKRPNAIASKILTTYESLKDPNDISSKPKNNAPLTRDLDNTSETSDNAASSTKDTKETIINLRKGAASKRASDTKIATKTATYTKSALSTKDTLTSLRNNVSTKRATDIKEAADIESTTDTKCTIDTKCATANKTTLDTKSAQDTKTKTAKDTKDKLSFYCCVCPKRWISGCRLRKHLKNHKGHEKAIFCRVCSEYFATDAQCEEHREKVHKVVHKCEECGKVMKNHSTLLLHMASHTTSRPFQCDLCPRTFKTQKVLNDHVRYGHPPENATFLCHLCDKTYKNSSSLKEHVSRCGQGDDRPHKCNECQTRYKSKSYLCAHIRMVHRKEKKHVCTTCGVMFATKHMVDAHMMIHTDERPYGCEQCDKRFRKKDTLNRHMRSHTGEKPYVCLVCDKRYGRLFSLTEHLRIHTGEKPYTCDDCPRSFRQLNRYQRHLRSVHTGERPFGCEKCGKKFVDRDSLASHARTHSDVRGYKCKECSRSFKWASSLRYHEHIHSDTRPYNCIVCGKGFRQPHALTVHLRIHSGEMPYQCRLCETRFKDNSQFQQHKRTHSMLGHYPCRRCTLVFPYRESLRGHVQTVHLGVVGTKAVAEENKGQVSCHECGREFSCKATLRFHLRTHTSGTSTVTSTPSTSTTTSAATSTKTSTATSTGTGGGSKVMPAKYTCIHCGRRFKQRAPCTHHMKRCRGSDNAMAKTDDVKEEKNDIVKEEANEEYAQ